MFFIYIYIYIRSYVVHVPFTRALRANVYIIGERREPHTYRTAEKNLRHIYIYVFYIYIYIYIRSYVVHVSFTRALRANVGPAGIIGERREPHTYRTAEKNLRHIYIYVFYIYIYIYTFVRRARAVHASGASPTLIVQLRKIFVIYIYMFFIYIYIYIRSYVVHVPFTRALRANVYIIGERREPHTYRTAEKNLRHIYIYVFYIYIYIYTFVRRARAVHARATRKRRTGRYNWRAARAPHLSYS